MNTLKVKETVTKVTTNAMGGVIGGVAGYMVAKKVIKTEKMWLLAVVTVVGVIGGAMVQAKMKAKKGVPTANTLATTK